MKTLEELKKLDLKKLNEELEDLRYDLIKLQFEVKGGQAKNTHMVGSQKKQIARIKTIINSKA